MSAPPPRAPLSVNTESGSALPSGPRTPTGTPPRPGSAGGRAPSSGGQRIGPYIVGKTLGVGSTGRVKLGTHIETSQKVGIKIIPKESLPTMSSSTTTSTPPSSNTSPQLNKKLEREITIMKLIRHPNVLQLYDVYETDRELFLILEYVEGGELFDYLVKKGRLSESEACGFFQQICYGVDFCHRYMIWDLKPENLLLDRDLNVKIADFGMASLQVSGRMLETSCGSPHYASPEIIKGIRYDGPPADIWSCGVILYALLTGNLPFDDENIRKLLQKVKVGDFTIPDYVSVPAKELIKAMLKVDPSARITMKQIFQHPWFCSRPPKAGIEPPSGDDPVTKFSKPLDDINQLDPDILHSLTLLGWDDEKELLEALHKDQPTMEKVFYTLLQQRKYDFLEHYDARDMNVWDIEGGPKRRTSSYASLYGSNSLASSSRDLFKSELTLAAEGMRRSTDELRKSVDDLRRSREELGRREDSDGTLERRKSGDMLSEAGKGAVASTGTKKQGPNKIFTVASKYDTSVRVNSPLSASTTAFDGSSVRQSQTPPSSLPSTAGHSRESTPTADKKKLTISIPTSEEGAEDKLHKGSAQQQQADVEKGSLGTPRFHRKNRATAVPPTPVITSSPKRSWFSDIGRFFFKPPEVYTFTSNKSLEETLQTLADKLTAFDVKYAPLSRKESGFKCKYEGAPQTPTSSSSATGSPSSGSLSSSPSPSTPSPTSVDQQGQQQPQPMAVKAVKFRVDVVLDGEGSALETAQGPWKVTLQMQQGSNSSFQIIGNQFKTSWELDK